MSRKTSGLSCIFTVDKPSGMSSHDVVAKVRHIIGESRVGHAGTLDPAATGVLVVGVGPATRLLGMLTLDEKSYEAKICFGSQTSTDDAEGEIIRQASVPAALLDKEFAASELAALVGEHEQVPPAFSAVSVNGCRAYMRARAGEKVELAPRHVQIFEAHLLGITQQAQDCVVWRCAFRVSKGTYIRSIARDLGLQLKTAAHLSALCRTSSGGLSLDTCVSLDELKVQRAQLLCAHAVDPVRALGLPVRLLDAHELSFVSDGKHIPVGSVIDVSGNEYGLRPPKEAEMVSIVYGNHLLGLWKACGPVLICKANFPGGVSGVRP